MPSRALDSDVSLDDLSGRRLPRSGARRRHAVLDDDGDGIDDDGANDENGHNASDMHGSSVYDYLIKVIIIGPSGTGKTCLLHRFVDDKFTPLTSQTVGVEFASKVIPVGTGSRSKRIKLQLWDTAGQERFRSVSRSYFRGAAGALLVYDVANRESFTRLHEWLMDARALASPKLYIVLVGAKTDLNGATSISAAEAAAWALEHGIQHSIQVSALDGSNVTEAFERMAQGILARIELGQIDPDSHDSGIQYGESGFGPTGRSRFDRGGMTLSSRWIGKHFEAEYGLTLDRSNRSCSC